jgi:hypothetical protein
MSGHGTRLITGCRNTPGSVFNLFAGKKLVFSIVVACICFSFSLHAQNTYYSRASTAFNTASTWSTSPTGTPQNGTAIANNDIFIIQSGHNVTVGASRTIAQITVNSGGTLTLGAFILTVSGNWTNNGTITGSTGRMNSTTGTLINNGLISFSGAGGIIKTSGTLTNSATGSITVVGAGIITLGSGNFVNSNVLTPTAVNFGSSTISLTGTVAAQTIGGFSTTGQFLTTRGSGSVITLTGDIRCANISMTGNGAVLSLGTGRTHIVNGGVSLSVGGLAGSDLAGGSSILYVYGGAGNAFTGTGVNFRADTGTVVFAGAAAQTLGGTGTGAKTFYNLTLDGANTKTNAGGITVNNILTYQGATSAIPSTTFTFGPNAMLRYNSAVNRTTTTNEWPANIAAGTLGGGVLIENSGDIALNGSKVLGSGIPITIETTAVLSMGTNSLTVSSDITNNGGALNGTSVTNGLVLTGTANQSIGAVSISGPVVVAKPSNTISVIGNITAGGLQVINSGAGLLDLGPTLTHSFGNFTGTSGSWDANSSLVSFSGSATHANATLVAGSSTVSFTGNATQTIPPYTYYNLGLSGSGTKNIATATSVGVGNNWTVSGPTNLAGTANITVTGNIYGTGNLTMTSGALRIAGDWAKTGSFSAGAGTVLYYGTTQLVGGLTYNNLQIATAGVKTMAASSTVSSGLIIHPASTLELGTLTLTLSGAGAVFTNNGTLDAGNSSTVLYAGNNAQNVVPATYHNLSFTGSGIRTIPAGSTVTVNNAWNIHAPVSMPTTAGAVVTGTIGGNGSITQGTGGTISLAGAWTNSGTLTGTGTVNYNGITQTVANAAYHHLTVSNTGIKTLATSTTVKGALTINPVSTIDIGGFTLTLSGSGTPLVNNGNFVAGNSSTVHYTSTGSATIAAAEYFNLQSTGGIRTLAGTGTIGILGGFIPVSGSFNASTSTVDFKGAGLQVIPAFTFNKLIVSNAGIKHIIASVIVNCQTIDIEDDASVEINADGGGRLNVMQ